MKSIIAYFNTRSFLVNLISVAICILGVFTAIDLKRDLIPPFEFNRVQVDGSLIGANAEQMEKLVTIPVQDAISALPDIKRIDSKSYKNRSSITVYFDQDVKIDDMINEINTRLTTIQNELPDDIEDFSVNQHKLNDVNLLGYGIEGFDSKNINHRDWFKSFKSDIKQIPGIAKISDTLPEIQVQISLKKDKLNQFGLTQSEIINVLRQHMSFYPIANKQFDNMNYNIEINTTPQSLEDIRNIPLKANRFARTIFVKDVATVDINEVKNSSKNLINNKDTLAVYINKDTRSDAINLSKLVNEYIEKPENNGFQFKLIELFDTSNLIQKQLKLLASNGSMGLILVAILLSLVIGFRFSMVTLIGLPIAYLGTIILLGWLDIPFDLISFVAMILIVGILVDDAIIVAEKYADLLKEGVAPKEASYQAALSMLAPVTGTILTTAIAFAPILLIKSEMTTIMYSIPIVIISALAISWFECFFILPNHLQHFVTSVSETKTRIFDKLSEVYEKTLRIFFKIRYITFILIAGLFASAAVIAPGIRKNYNLNIDIPSIRINYELSNAKSLEDAEKQIKPLFQYLHQTLKDDTTYMQTRLGWAWFEGKSRSGYQYGYIRLYIEQTHERPNEKIENLKDKIKDKIEEFANNDQYKYLKIREQQSSGEEDNDDKHQVDLHISGDDKYSVVKIKEMVAKSIKPFKELTNLVEEDSETEMVWSFISDHEKLKLHGISSLELTTQIRSQIDKVQLKELRINGESLEVVAFMDDNNLQDFHPNQLRNIDIMTGNDTIISLNYLGEWQRKQSPKSIRHLNQRRTLVFPVKFNPDLVEEKKAEELLQQAIQPLRKKLSTYKLETKALSMQDEETNKWAIKVAGTVLISILLVLALVLNSLSQPFIVGMAIPFGIIGVIFALKTHNMPLSIMGMIGLIGVAGVAVNDSLIMVDTINKLKGKYGNTTLKEHIIKGCRSRFRAIFLTTITTLGGVFPMAYGWFGESGFTQPLAFAMGWGLLSATILTLYGIPVLYGIREDFFKLGRRLKNIFSKFLKFSKTT